MSLDNDPQPRWLLDDPWFADALLGEIRDLTRILYPEARTPETAMKLPEAKAKYDRAIEAARSTRSERIKQANAACRNAEAEAWLIYLQDAGLDETKMPPLCIECGVNRSDPPSKLCPGCEAYREHTR